MNYWFRFLDWLTATFGSHGRSAIPRETLNVRPVGIVRNGVHTPRPEGWAHVVSDVVLRAELLDMLEGIEGYSHIIVVYALHKVPESEQRVRVRPGADARIPEQGVLATRSQLRPSPIGVSVVRLLKRRRNIMRVEGLDAIDGTPVLDVKPYFPNYDAVPDASIPAWAEALAAEGFTPAR
ncbi:MAG: tRNA (N6-threonylcarbamoyladenosine(37)-N6)-methyltransferase TrmO [Dehalococcoidia bacterium]|nr:tRNA (N6-threonylcarbamoyladenosine(37)-N6)-methyltransferase TrmO [Dehalococcoidia bacterium]